MPSSIQEVLSTPELLVEILSGLDMRTLLLSQRVSRFWQGLVTGTPALQRLLFFEPIAAKSNAELTKHREINPLLQAAFPPFFKEPTQYEDSEVTRLSDLLVQGGHKTFSFLDSRSWDKRGAFLREGASWRRMLVQQPAALKLGYIESQGASQRSYYNSCLNQPDGLRMHALYDLVYQFMGHQEEKSDRQWFGVYWRDPRHDPPVSSYSWKCGCEEPALKDLAEDVAVVILRNMSGNTRGNLNREVDKSSLSTSYLPEEWEGEKVTVKFINSQDWFG